MEYSTMQNLHPHVVTCSVTACVFFALALTVGVGMLVRWFRG